MSSNQQHQALENTVADLGLELGELRAAISEEYAEVASKPNQEFHFHTGRPLAQILGYSDAWLEGIPETAIESFAGTGNPFSIGELAAGDRIVDVGCGAGIDSFIAAREVGPSGEVVGVDMTPEMLEKAGHTKAQLEADNLSFRAGHAEDLPVEDGWADILISNGVLNLTPDKRITLQEWFRTLKPGGRLQIADILVTKQVPTGAKRKIELWTG